MRFMVSGVADDETRLNRCGAFCRRGGNKRCLNGCRNAAAHASQGCCGVADFWGRVRGNFFGRKNEMSAWRRVVIIDMYFLTVASVSSKHKTQPFDHHLTLYVVVVFSWLSKVSEPDYEPTYFGIHHMDIADGTS